MVAALITGYWLAGWPEAGGLGFDTLCRPRVCQKIESHPVAEMDRVGSSSGDHNFYEFLRFEIRRETLMYLVID